MKVLLLKHRLKLYRWFISKIIPSDLSSMENKELILNYYRIKKHREDLERILIFRKTIHSTTKKYIAESIEEMKTIEDVLNEKIEWSRF